MWNIIVGTILLIGGLSGRMVLIFTKSSGALAAVGGAMIALGIGQIIYDRRKRREDAAERTFIP